MFRTGNSLAVSIPARMVKGLGISAGQSVLVEEDLTAGQLRLTFPDHSQLSLLGVSQGEQVDAE